MPLITKVATFLLSLLSWLKEKCWNYVVRFEGQAELKTCQVPAASIKFFVDSSPCPCIQHNQFKLAAFKGTVEEVLGEQKIGVENTIGKLELATFNPEDAQDWKRFWS